MNFRAFKEKSVEEQIEYLCDALDGKFVNDNIDAVREQLFAPGHTTIAHQNISSEEILTRTISELKAISAFETEESAESLVEALLYDKIRDVALWLNSENPRPLALTLNMREHVGKGVDTDFNEKTTNVLTVVLQKDRDVMNDFGFHVKTAYPNILHEEAQYTGRNLQKEALQVLAKTDAELCRGFWGLKMSGFQAFVNNKSADTKISVYFSQENTKYNLVFSQYSIPVLYCNKNDGSTKSYRDINNSEIPIGIRNAANRAINVFSSYTQNIEIVQDAKNSIHLTSNSLFSDKDHR